MRIEVEEIIRLRTNEIIRRAGSAPSDSYRLWKLVETLERTIIHVVKYLEMEEIP